MPNPMMGGILRGVPDDSGPSLGESAQRVLPLIPAYPDEVREFRHLMIINPCIDDSGSDPGQSHFVLGGYLAPAEEWLRFSDEWQTMLDCEPRIRYFKLKEAVRLKDQFRVLENPGQGDHRARFTSELRDRRVELAFSIIKKYAIGGIVHVMPRTLHEEFIRGKVAPAMDNPYLPGFFDITLGLAVRQKSLFPNDVFEFVFDYQSKLGDVAGDWYRRFRAILPPEHQEHLGANPIFRDDVNFYPLQAADTLAWIMRRKHYDQLEGLHLPAHLIPDLLDGINFVQSTTWDRKKVESMYGDGGTFQTALENLEAWKGKISDGQNPLLDMMRQTKLSPVRLSDLPGHDVDCDGDENDQDGNTVGS